MEHRADIEIAIIRIDAAGRAIDQALGNDGVMADQRPVGCPGEGSGVKHHQRQSWIDEIQCSCWFGRSEERLVLAEAGGVGVVAQPQGRCLE